MVQYTGGMSCPKCGYDKFSVAYIGATEEVEATEETEHQPAVPEHLWTQCLMCAFQQDMLTKDTPVDVVPIT